MHKYSETRLFKITIQRPSGVRRQDLLRGVAKMEIMSQGTRDGLHGRMQQLLDD